MIGEAYPFAHNVVERRRGPVKALADALVTRRALDGAEAALIIGGRLGRTTVAGLGGVLKGAVPKSLA